MSELLPEGSTARRWIPGVALALIVLVAAWLRLFQIGSPIAGFHVFNEGFYTDLAAFEAGRGIFEWITAPKDLNNPPFYTVVVASIFRILGSSTTIARVVSVVAGVSTVAVTYPLGRTLFNQRIALFSAAFLAVMPGAVLINRNAQVDSLFVLLQMACVYVYVLAIKRDDNRLAFVSGALLGLAVLTKLPAVLVLAGLAIWETWRGRGFTWLKRRRTVMALAGFAVTGLPWHLYQIAVNTSQYFTTQSGVGGSAERPDAFFWRYALSAEFLGMHWPLFAVFVLAGIVFISVRRTTGDKLIIALIAVNLLFYMVFHMHTYYLLPIAAFTALAAARLLEVIVEKVPVVGWGALTVFMVGLIIASFVTVTGHKLAPYKLAEVPPVLGAQANGADLWVEPTVWMNVGPAIDVSIPDMTVRRVPEDLFLPDPSEVANDRPSYFLTAYDMTDAAGGPVPEVATLYDSPIEVVVFGTAIHQSPDNYNVMANGPWRVRWGAYSPFTFGLKEISPQVIGPFVYRLEDVAASPTP